MRIGYLLGRLGRGGAELQLLTLAGAMAQAGHTVSLLAYDGASDLDEELLRQGVEVLTAEAASRASKVSATQTWYATFRPDVVHAVMKRASSLAVLARLPRRKPPVIATDMSTATYGRHKPVLWGSLMAFGLADRVVTQTELNRVNLERLPPWLRGKTQVIRNGLDIDKFNPASADASTAAEPFRFCAVGTVYPVKNPDRVVRAVAQLRASGRTGFRVDWYGRLGRPGEKIGRERHPTIALADELGVADLIHFHGDTPAIERAYRASHALLHASIQEGFPNVVAEAMACGLPLVVSTVSDLPLVIRTADNGFVFDERDVGAIASAMSRMLDTPAAERRAMSERSRELAVSWFAIDRFAREFGDLYRDLSGRA